MQQDMVSEMVKEKKQSRKHTVAIVGMMMPQPYQDYLKLMIQVFKSGPTNII